MSNKPLSPGVTLKLALDRIAGLEAELQAELVRAQCNYHELESKLLDLLAVIHRDGGHKVEELGLQAAWEQAMQLSSERIADSDRLRSLEN
jgi:hypothetical protein